MAADYRKLERFLANFFRTRGNDPTYAHGDIKLGVCTTELEETRDKNGTVTTAKVIVPSDCSVSIISLSDLAQELSEEFS